MKLDCGIFEDFPLLSNFMNFSFCLKRLNDISKILKLLKFPIESKNLSSEKSESELLWFFKKNEYFDLNFFSLLRKIKFKFLYFWIENFIQKRQQFFFSKIIGDEIHFLKKFFKNYRKKIFQKRCLFIKENFLYYFFNKYLLFFKKKKIYP